jgi:hypothetical protein
MITMIFEAVLPARRRGTAIPSAQNDFSPERWRSGLPRAGRVRAQTLRHARHDGRGWDIDREPLLQIVRGEIIYLACSGSFHEKQQRNTRPIRHSAPLELPICQDEAMCCSEWCPRRSNAESQECAAFASAPTPIPSIVRVAGDPLAAVNAMPSRRKPSQTRASSRKQSARSFPWV